MRKPLYMIVAALAAFFMFTFSAAAALAAGSPAAEETVITDGVSESNEDTEMITDIPVITNDYSSLEGIPADEDMPDAPVTDYPETPPKPFTPPGTGTVIDNVTDSDGKEFYTIKTPDEHIFYLVIDKQRNTENVYFLNAVTVDDLTALAEQPAPPKNGMNLTPPPSATPEPPEETPPEPQPAAGQDSGGNNRIVFLVIAIVLIGGVAGWYFKVYKPKQKKLQMEEDTDYTHDDGEYYGNDDDDEIGPPQWNDDDETPDGTEDE